MPKIIGVRFRNTGKVYYFDPGDFTIHYHDHVVVETARGVEYGTVVITPTDMPEGKIAGPLKKVIRMATKEDDERDEANREREKEAYHVCKQRIAERGLDMKLIGGDAVHWRNSTAEYMISAFVASSLFNGINI